MIRDFYNHNLYDGNKEVDAIVEAIQPEMDSFEARMLRAVNIANPSTAGNGIELWERVLGITANPEIEDIPFRIARVIFILSAHPPYTERVMAELIDAAVGDNMWDYILDHNNYRLDIVMLKKGRNWRQLIIDTLQFIIPANIVWEVHLYMQTWEAVHDDNDSWEQVFNDYPTWEDVLYD